jgi:hypothetical protein
MFIFYEYYSFSFDANQMAMGMVWVMVGYGEIIEIVSTLTIESFFG